MGFFGGLLQAGSILALDTIAALVNGQKSVKAKDLKNKSFASDAYGNPWPRCRGTVRLQGKVLCMTNIRTSIWKTVHGGLFGLGSQSVYYNLYSVSMYVGFGKKLGGGSATAFLRIWADGKLLYNAPISTASISGTVSASIITGGQLTGSQNLLVDLASGASLSLSPGDMVEIPGDPNFGYQVQTAVTATGPATQVAIPIWPPLRVDIAGGGLLTVAGLSNGVWDLTSFDPNPHDGSHTAGGYPCPPGGVDFFLGSDTQEPSAYIVKILGEGNVPGYRGLTGILIRDLQLRNYGDHPPQITAEIAFDTATPQYPTQGPISGVALGTNGADRRYMAMPFSGPTSLNFTNPLQNQLPYVFAFTTSGGASSGVTAYRINTQTNLLETSLQIPITVGHLVGPFCVDSDGFFYFVSSVGLGAWQVFKWDGLSFSQAASYGDGISGDIGVQDPAGIYCWDEFQSLFGNDLKIKLLSTMAVFGGLIIYDRTSLLPFGTNGTGSENVCWGYDKNGSPLIGVGTVTSNPGTPYGSPGINGDALTVDGDGNVWTFQNDTLSKYDSQFQSSVYFDQNNLPHEYLAPASFSRTDYVISSSVGAGGGSLVYYPGDNTLVVFGVSGIAKVDVKTGTVVSSAANPAGGVAIAVVPSVDVMGTILGTATGSVWYRIDAATLAVTSSYTLSNWSAGGGGAYDQLSDSLWLLDIPNVVRAYLDRGNGSGIGRDSIISSLMSEAGYDPSTQFDVTLVAAQGKTCKGIEFERESYQESLRKILPSWLIDPAPIDGKIVFIPRGQSSVATIPEDDLGALGDPSQYEARVVETIQDPLDTPESVHMHYYDTLRQDQEAVQYAKRISKPYASSLSSGKSVTSSRQQLDISLPITEDATAVKKMAELVLWDAWTGRTVWKFKLGPKYSRLTVGDVITVVYKGQNNLLRIEQIDSGASGALAITARTQDNSVYSETYLPTSAPGLGSGQPTTQPTVSHNNYTLNPDKSLSEVSATQIAMVDVVATFDSGARTFYNARNFTVTDPGVGNSQLYYVSIKDLQFTGEVPGGTTLPDFAETTPEAAHLGEEGYIFMGTILVTHDTTGVVVTSGGSQNITQAEGFYVNDTGNTGVTAREDLLNYAIMDGRRATMHLTGSAANSPASNIYSYLDTSTHSIALIKASGGWAADILLYYSDYIKQFITELQDPGHLRWSDPSSYKKFHTPLPVMPRYRTIGEPPTVLDNPAPNLYDRIISCSVLDTIDAGRKTNITSGPVSMNFDNDGAGGGNLGTVQVMVNERYAGATARERFFFARGLGLVRWDAATLVSGVRITGVYKITNWAVHNKLVSGGGVSPSFACSYGVGWP